MFSPTPDHPALQTRDMLAANLTGWSDRDLDALTLHTHTELQHRVGEVLANGLTDAQLTEFGRLADQSGGARCAQWLRDNLPEHRAAVATVRARLVAEVTDAVAAAGLL